MIVSLSTLGDLPVVAFSMTHDDWRAHRDRIDEMPIQLRCPLCFAPLSSSRSKIECSICETGVPNFAFTGSIPLKGEYLPTLTMWVIYVESYPENVGDDVASLLKLTLEGLSPDAPFYSRCVDGFWEGSDEW